MPLRFAMYAATALLVLTLGCSSRKDSSTGGDAIRLEDVSAGAWGDPIAPGQLGPALTGTGNGAALADLDNDGDLDLVFPRLVHAHPSLPGGPSLLLRNETPRGGPLHFVRDPSFEALTQGLDAIGVALGDYDKDGRVDIFLACAGQDHLFHNGPDGTFEDVSAQAGIGGKDRDITSGAAWVDLNDDGYLDLYVANFFRTPPSIWGNYEAPEENANRLYVNQRDGTFRDVSTTSRTNSLGATHAVAAGDIDGDGVIELYVCNDKLKTLDPPDAWYVRERIDENSTPIFRDFAELHGVQTLRSTMGASISDVDGDGLLDVYVTAIGAKRVYFGSNETYLLPENAYQWGLEAASDGDNGPQISWSPLPLDLDHDGSLEYFVVQGLLLEDTRLRSNPYAQQHSIYLRQTARGQRFEQIQDSVGLVDYGPDGDHLGRGIRGAYPGDLDGDGDLDVVISAATGTFHVLENRTTTTSHFLRLRLRGTVSAPDPIGARVHVLLSGGGELEAQRILQGMPYGHGDNFVDLGLGDRSYEEVWVRWPSGLSQRVDGAAGFGADREITLVEPGWLSLSSPIVAPGEMVRVTLAPPPESSWSAHPNILLRRSDGVPVGGAWDPGGGYVAALQAPAASGELSLQIVVDGELLPIRPVLRVR